MSDKTSGAYQAALQKLRRRHMDEFDELFQAECDLLGVQTQRFTQRQRRDQILKYVKRKKGVTVGDLAAHFDMAYTTARKDLDGLMDAGLVTQVGLYPKQYLPS